MPLITYIERKLSAASMDAVDHANAIIAEYQAQGFDLTLRQLYYQFVSRDLIANSDREYKRLGSIINDARLTGLVDWNAITDRTRFVRSVSHWTDPQEIMRSAAASFRLDKWSGQPYRLEVWIEKDALVGVIEGVCTELDLPYFSCRGYTSQSEMWAAAQRLESYVAKDQTPVILHLGDHDPSGKDMTRDITERLELFMGGVTVQRLALNMQQIEQYDPPPNPAKITDSRASAYIAEFGDSSWELDALEPRVISDLIRTVVDDYRIAGAWETVVQQELTHRAQIRSIAARWSHVVAVLDTKESE